MHCNYDEIKSVISDKLKTSGFAKSTADNIAQGILLSEMSGETSHGLRLYYAVNQCVTSCVWEGVKLPKITASYAVVDCQYGVGLDSAKRCMDIAIKGAAENGIYTVFAHHANTFGAAFVYALQAVKQGMIGIVMANTPAQMPVYKGKQRLLGKPTRYAMQYRQKTSCPLSLIWHPARLQNHESTKLKSAEKQYPKDGDWIKTLILQPIRKKC